MLRRSEECSEQLTNEVNDREEDKWKTVNQEVQRTDNEEF